MPRPKSAVPPLRHHKSTGRAVVYLDRKSVFLGKWDSPESRQKYAEIVSKLTSGEPVAGMSSRVTTNAKPVRHSVAALCLRFKAEKLPTYARAEQACISGAMRILCELFGDTPTADFGPIRLRAVRNAMVAGDRNAVGRDGEPKPRQPWSRSFVNKQVKRLKHLFRWGVSWEIVPSTVADALGTVESLKAGDTEAAEGRPRRAVPDADLQAVRAVLSERQRDIFDLLLLTGARPGEIIGLTMGDLDRTAQDEQGNSVWRVDLRRHKTAHKGKSRSLFFYDAGQAILQKYLKADPAARLFSIRVDTFGAAVKAACATAGVPEFTPHWIRHTVATKVADVLGTEAAQRLLGHSGIAMTMHYSRAAERLAMQAARKLG